MNNVIKTITTAIILTTAAASAQAKSFYTADVWVPTEWVTLATAFGIDTTYYENFEIFAEQEAYEAKHIYGKAKIHTEGTVISVKVQCDGECPVEETPVVTEEAPVVVEEKEEKNNETSTEKRLNAIDVVLNELVDAAKEGKADPMFTTTEGELVDLRAVSFVKYGRCYTEAPNSGVNGVYTRTITTCVR